MRRRANFVGTKFGAGGKIGIGVSSKNKFALRSVIATNIILVQSYPY